MIVKAISRLIGCAGMARTLQKHRYNKLAYNQFNRPFDEWSADLKRRLRPATEYLLLALSGQSNHARVCPLLDQSRQSWILARDGLSASLIGRSGSSAFKPSITTFQTIHHCSVDVAHGLVLLFGIGTKALPLWDSRTRRNNLLRGLAVRLTIGPSGHANSSHPSSREGHHSTARWSSGFLLSHLIL